MIQQLYVHFQAGTILQVKKIKKNTKFLILDIKTKVSFNARELRIFKQKIDFV